MSAVKKFARGSDSPRRPTRSDLRKYVYKCSRPPAELARANFSTAETRIKQRNRTELQARNITAQHQSPRLCAAWTQLICCVSLCERESRNETERNCKHGTSTAQQQSPRLCAAWTQLICCVSAVEYVRERVSLCERREKICSGLRQSSAADTI